MTTEELIEWVDAAISVREDSYIENSGLPYYSLNIVQALSATKPKDSKEYDFSIACMVITYADDIADWMEQINLANQAQKV